MSYQLDSTYWQSNALCGDINDINFFAMEDLEESESYDSDALEQAELETSLALSVCTNCPVKRECLQSALDNKDRFGVWGGNTSNDIRKALSIDKNGDPVVREKNQVCLNCKRDKSLTVIARRSNQITIECTFCGITWQSAKAQPEKQRNQVTSKEITPIVRKKSMG